jgi:hypothetical protein
MQFFGCRPVLFVSSSISGKSFVALCPGSQADDSGPRLCLRYVMTF